MPFTVAELLGVLRHFPDAPRSQQALGLVMQREAQDGGDAMPWPARLDMLLDSADYAEIERLTLLGETLAGAERPPLLFDGEPADLTDFGAVTPRQVSCGGYMCPPPTVRMLIAAQTLDPTMGILYGYHVVQDMLDLSESQMLEMPLPVFANLEQAVAFLARAFLTRTIALPS